MLVVDPRGGDQLPVHSVPGPARALQLPHGAAAAAAPAPPVELQTNVLEDYAKFHNHGEGPYKDPRS